MIGYLSYSLGSAHHALYRYGFGEMARQEPRSSLLLTNAYWGNNICVTEVCQTAVHQHIPMTATYRVSIRQTEERYSVSCPGLPGCWSEGKTEADALANNTRGHRGVRGGGRRTRQEWRTRVGARYIVPGRDISRPYSRTNLPQQMRLSVRLVPTPVASSTRPQYKR